MASLTSLSINLRSSLLPKPLRISNPISSMAAARHFTTRSFHKVDTKAYEPWDFHDAASIQRGFYSKCNSLLTNGPRGAYGTRRGDDGLYMRVDIPGVGRDGLKVWVEKDCVCFEGEGIKPEHEGGVAKRYAGGFICDTDTYDLKKVDAVLKDGILRMRVPKHKVIGL